MNTLSWLIYFIGVAQSLGTFGIWLAIPGTIGLSLVLLFWVVISATETANPDLTGAKLDYHKAELITWWAFWKMGRNMAMTLWIMGWLIIIFVPSRQTLLFIAGSELSEQALKSEEVKNVVNPGIELLKSWMKEEISRLKNQSSQHKKTE